MVTVRQWPRYAEENDMTDDRVKGGLDQAKGVIKEQAGKVAGDSSTELSGKLDQAKGKLETKIGDAKDAIRDNEDRRR
jgi:uncharacterized protein YjbJ (UPF0337 family)